MGEPARSLQPCLQTPPIVAVLGAVSGVGRTTVAALLARALRDRDRDGSVLAVDLGGSGAGLTAALGGIDPEGASDDHVAPTDDTLVGLDILTPAVHPSHDDVSNVAAVTGLVDDVAGRYSAVVIDTPCDVSWHTLATLRVANAIVIVATPSSDGITSAVSSARRLARAAPGRTAWVVVNRATPRAARATFAAIEDCYAALGEGTRVELRFLCAVSPDAGLAQSLSRPLVAAGASLDSWNLAAARRAAGTLASEVSS